jgi:outer membrane protein OmpA-like peptidoglycan-associated protein
MLKFNTMNKTILLFTLGLGPNFLSFSQQIEILKHPESISISNLSQLNTIERECNISIMPDGKTLFFMSTRNQQNSNLGGNGDIYQTKLINNVWQNPVALGDKINTTSGEDEPSIDAEGKVMYFQSWAGDWRAKGGPYFQANLSDKGWNNVKGLGGGITQFFAKESSANFGYGTDGMAVSADGNLFIVACGPDYDGEMDIYYSVKKMGVWGFPQLMGISTNGDERSVFIAGDNKTIYFSSDALGGFGGLDIFKVVIDKNGKLGQIINIGAPFNTPANDLGFVASVDGKSAFFIRDLDIYYADISQLSEKIKPINPIIDTLTVQVKEEVVIIQEKKEAISLQNELVYFNFDDYQLLESEKQRLMARLKGMGELNQLKITLSGHCDNIGESIYNDYLSDFRVKAVAAYLQELGIPVNQIETKTFGERMPVKSNTNELGRKLNRRVEVVFTIPN